MKLFHICTIANKLDQYEQMKSSFIKAGFDEVRCQYSLFDNSQGNVYEPYSTLNTVDSLAAPYIIYCHQDVLLDQGDGLEHLVKILGELDKLDPNWAILGNAGINNNYEKVVRVTDPNRMPHWHRGLPEMVHSLDENFLVIKSQANIKCSQELQGFHLYATDLCLNAILKRYSCYVIDFHLTHLSGGNFSQDFYDSQRKFQQRWSREFDFCYVKTMTDIVMFLSKHKSLQYIFSRYKLSQWFVSRRRLRALINVQSQ